ncbi:universal stress protein [Mycolicibacterium goodii]|uniref:universal stress protein n=1 Tax=Mycolicibacterium goodii TaxID=134601 RepID=UPI001BDD3478|nr:universal stress protein [Mycolicibacterium goodii]MBU8811354.1 universal stress protein [Mycolicibacterium goodii]MBU8831867.1 universal stress protein [Mycolicibacterium goodii]
MNQQNRLRRIVVGVDGSRAAQDAVRWAAREAVLRDVPVTIVHVLAALPVAAAALTWPVGRVPEEVMAALENDGRRYVADAVTNARECVDGAKLDVTGELLIGHPVQALTEVSAAGLFLVVAGHDGSGKHHRLLGSVSTGVIHRARCPVVVVRGRSPQTGRLPVLVGIDGSTASEAATAIAFDDASWRGVDLVALHVWSDSDMTSLPSLETSAQQRVAEETLAQRLAGWQEKYPDVIVHRLVRYDRPAQQLLEESCRAQVVVVGSRGRGGFAGLILGSVGATVAQEAQIPVIVARG